MTYTVTSITKTLSAVVITCAVAAFYATPAAAQSANSLDCSQCVKSKHLKNGGIKGKDLLNIHKGYIADLLLALSPFGVSTIQGIGNDLVFSAKQKELLRYTRSQRNNSLGR